MSKVRTRQVGITQGPEGIVTIDRVGMAEWLRTFLSAACPNAEDRRIILAEFETVTRERDEAMRHLKLSDAEMMSERDRRVAAQEAITEHWAPTVEVLTRERDEARSVLALFGADRFVAAAIRASLDAKREAST